MTACLSISLELSEASVIGSTVSCQFWKSTTSSSKAGASGNNASGVSTLLQKETREREQALKQRHKIKTSKREKSGHFRIKPSSGARRVRWRGILH